MANISWFSSLALFSILLATLITLSVALDTERKVYIVYMGAKRENELAAVNQQNSILYEVLQDGTSVVESLVHSYKRSFNGFAAKLTEEESKKIADLEGVISVFPSTNYQLHTSRSWDFLGLSQSVKRVPTVESNVIVGMLDSGIWPESESFHDRDLGPPPKKWKGTCDQAQNFTCNNKIIGARAYGGEPSPRDLEGHGTHTASTVAGRTVKQASLFGIAEGEARGGVPSARIAVYKVCSTSGCTSQDILAGFDDAIADGVDIISVSLGSSDATDFSADPVAIGSFHALASGILTSNSAGNSGPTLGTTSSVAPWMLSVAASSIDRKITSKVTLGNGKSIAGVAVNTFSMNGTGFPLISGGDAITTDCDEASARACLSGCLDSKKVEGKILLCESQGDGKEALIAGALGLITGERIPDVGFVYPLPATALSPAQIDEVASDIDKTRNAQATIFKSESSLDKEAPEAAAFSSRGPNKITANILKPDLSAPGVNILAAWSPKAHLTEVEGDERSSDYHIISGTSMACPHATAAAAYVKTFHPDWSPSAIKSALMTTATPMNQTNNEDAEFAYGSGNINPVKATNPGLVFDSTKNNFIELLCNIGYTKETIRLISGDDITCPDKPTGSENDLNYPSVALRVEPDSKFTANFSRIVTNVGKPNSVYRTKIVGAGTDVGIEAVPRGLQFTALNQKKGFQVGISGSGLKQGTIRSFAIEWTDGEHLVRIPVVVYAQ